MVWKDNGGGDYEQPPLGTHAARCVGMIDLGTQNGTFGAKRKVMITWELSNELNSKQEPFTISAFFTQSLNEKATLRAVFKSWRGRDFTDEELRGFDPKKVLGAPCMVNIVEHKRADGSTKPIVQTVTTVPKGMQVPAQQHPSKYLSLEPHEFSQAVFDDLGDKLKDMVKASPEWKALQAGADMVEPALAVVGGISDDDIPF